MYMYKYKLCVCCAYFWAKSGIVVELNFYVIAKRDGLS